MLSESFSRFLYSWQLFFTCKLSNHRVLPNLGFCCMSSFMSSMSSSKSDLCSQQNWKQAAFYFGIMSIIVSVDMVFAGNRGSSYSLVARRSWLSVVLGPARRRSWGLRGSSGTRPVTVNRYRSIVVGGILPILNINKLKKTPT